MDEELGFLIPLQNLAEEHNGEVKDGHHDHCISNSGGRQVSFICQPSCDRSYYVTISLFWCENLSAKEKSVVISKSEGRRPKKKEKINSLKLKSRTIFLCSLSSGSAIVILKGDKLIFLAVESFQGCSCLQLVSKLNQAADQSTC